MAGVLMTCLHAGPRDRPFEEQHSSIAIAVVLNDRFNIAPRKVPSHGAGISVDRQLRPILRVRSRPWHRDHCVAFHYSPEFFERASASCQFPINRIPPIASLTPWIVKAGLAAQSPETAVFDEMAHGLAGAVLEVLDKHGARTSTAASDERRISQVARFIEAQLAEPLPLERLAAAAKMSTFHFLRVFKQVTGVTPHNTSFAHGCAKRPPV